MNREHLQQWVEGLRHTTRGQAQTVLGIEHEDGQVSMCCLGIGCEVAGIAGRVEFERLHFEGEDELPPASFHRWLGINDGDDGFERSDVMIDWPDGLTARGGMQQPFSRSVDTRTAAGLNDRLSLTFAQIADVLDYFGVTDGVDS